jgi:Protein of unknown function (DUF3788)
LILLVHHVWIICKYNKMDCSVFLDKLKVPTDAELKENIGNTYELWKQLRDFVFHVYPNATEEWNFPGKKYGWSFRIKDKKRAIIYLLPREGYFKVAFVFGQKATDQIFESGISIEIKTELQNAKKYAEGRGIRIDINDDSKLSDIKNLIQIKLSN